MISLAKPWSSLDRSELLRCYIASIQAHWSDRKLRKRCRHSGFLRLSAHGATSNWTHPLRCSWYKRLQLDSARCGSQLHSLRTGKCHGLCSRAKDSPNLQLYENLVLDAKWWLTAIEAVLIVLFVEELVKHLFLNCKRFAVLLWDDCRRSISWWLLRDVAVIHDRNGTHLFLLHYPVQLLLSPILYALWERLVRIVLYFWLVDLRDLRSRIVNLKREHAALIILFSGGVAVFFRGFIDNLVQLVWLFFIVVFLMDNDPLILALLLHLYVIYGVLA